MNTVDQKKVKDRIDRCRDKVVKTAKEIRSHFFRNSFESRNNLLRVFRESLRVHGRSKEITNFRIDLALARSKLMGLLTEFYINCELLDEIESSENRPKRFSEVEKEVLLSHLESIFAEGKNAPGVIVSFLTQNH